MSERAANDRHAFDALIHALARKAVAEHLTRKPAPDCGERNTRTNHVPLPATDKAA